MTDFNAADGISTTGEYIAFHAAAHPASVAVIDDGQAYTFAEFHRNLNQFIGALEGLELAPGSVVAVEWQSLYVHWLVLLAFEALGMTTFTYSKRSMAEHRSLLAQVDLVLGSPGAMPGNARRLHVIDQAWVNSVLAGDASPGPRHVVPAPDAPLRVHHSSGTTGRAKRIVRTAAALEFRYRLYQLKVGYNRDSRYLVGNPFSIQTVYGNATSCLRAGGACVFDSRDFLHAVRGHEVTHVSMLPSALVRTLDRLPADFVKPDKLTVLTFGAPLSRQLRERALETFATRIVASYGTTETASICAMDADGVGTVFPGVHAEVVDDHDRPLFGQPGCLRIKSGGCISGYDDDPDATRRMFRNGWFYPGDVGVMLGPRSLKIVGRIDDLINLGGVKVNPDVIEEELMEIVDADDLAIAPIPDADGVSKACIAVVLQPSTSLKSIMDAAAVHMATYLGDVRFVEVKAIPRGPSGKVQRRELQALLAEIHPG